MSFLDEEARAVAAAPVLLELLEQPARFAELFEAYRVKDGLIDGAFLERLPLAREVWRRAGEADAAAAILALPPAFREAVFHGRRRDGAAATLAACLDAASDKAVKKRLKRLLYELKSAGVEPPSKPKTPFFRRLTLVPAENLPCYVSPADSVNERLIMYHESLRGGGARIFHVYERDGVHVLEFVDEETSRRKAREVIAERRVFDESPLLEIAPDFARFLLAKLRRRAQAAGRSFPAGFTTAMTRVNLADAPEKHPYHDVVDAQAVLARLSDLDASVELFREPEFMAWAVDDETFQSFRLSLDDMETSGLLVDDKQRDEQIIVRVNRAVDRFFTPARREAYADRLRDHAYLFALRGAAVAAETCAALAMRLDNPLGSLGSVSFFNTMLVRRFPPPKDEPKPESPGGLIL
jgi:hypothetical protein